MKYIIYLTALALLVSCNPLKRVTNNPALLEKAGRVWELTNPCINDSVIQFVQGKTDTLESITYDTVKVSETVNVPVTQIKTITRTLTKVDTLRLTVEDKRRLQLEISDRAADKIKHAAKVEQLNLQLESMQSNRDKWRLRFMKLAVLFALYIVFVNRKTLISKFIK
jgi:hypothetical protein